MLDFAQGLQNGNSREFSGRNLYLKWLFFQICLFNDCLLEGNTTDKEEKPVKNVKRSTFIRFFVSFLNLKANSHSKDYMADPIVGQVPEVGGSSQDVSLYLHGCLSAVTFVVSGPWQWAVVPLWPLPELLPSVMTGISMLIFITNHIRACFSWFPEKLVWQFYLHAGLPQ